MKSLTTIFTLFLIVIASSLFAQGKQGLQKDTVMVWGNCEMCQAKIEKAAKAAGAATAKWDVDSKVLSVSYNPAKSDMMKIEKAIAVSGYDTRHQTTTTEAYHKLPECCWYERKN